METLVIDIETERIQELKDILKSMNISFHSEIEKPYNPEFVARILKSREQYKEGKFTTIKTEDLWK